MEVTLRTEAAAEDVKQIENMIKLITEDMDELNEVILSTIPDGIETDWSYRVKQDWLNFYRADIPAAMEEIRLSAANLTAAINKLTDYSEVKE